MLEHHTNPVAGAPPRRDKRARSALHAVAKLAAAFAVVLAAMVAIMYSRPETLNLYSRLVGEPGITVEMSRAYGQGPRQTLDIYRPPSGVAWRDAIILFLYGGSWSSGDKSMYAFVGQALAARGFTTVIPDYRLYPQAQFPAFIDDVAAAYAWTARTFTQGCTPPRPIIIAGHSAGGHMAALLALDRSYIARQGTDIFPPAALIGLAGPYTFEPTTWPSTRAAFASVAATPDIARPVTFVANGAPPALLLHGAADTLVNLKNTRELAAALTAVGAPVETAEYPGIGHIGLVLSLSRPFRWRAGTLDKLVEFAGRFGGAAGGKAGQLERVLQPSPPC